MAFELRPVRVADHDAVAAIWHSSASLPGVGPAVMPTLDHLRERVVDEIETNWNVTVATDGAETLGFLALKRSEAVLAEIFVRPDALGRGIGQALIAQAKLAMPKGFTLFTRAANDRARRFYERAGLVQLGEDLHPRDRDPIVYYAWQPASTPG
jgi:ribosomal protein S18 acetylase RimI-like enzyme